MGQKAVKSNSWTKPAIKRLGEIKDVAGNGGPGTQGNGKS